MAVDRFGRTWPKQRFPIGKILLPASDLGLASGVQGELYYPDDAPLTLAVQLVQTPAGMRILQAAPSGAAVMTLPLPTQTNLIAPRTDVAGFTSADFASPAFTVGLFVLTITAISGTSPQFTMFIESKSSQGTYNEQNGGTFTAAKTAVGSYASALNANLSSEAALLGPAYRVRTTLTGTGPSCTWYLDLLTK